MYPKTLYPTLLFCLSLALLQTCVGGSGDKCAASQSYECPYLTEICEETVYVNDCLKCNGFLSTDDKNEICFDRKLLNAKENPDAGYLWRDIIGMIVWFVTAGVATSAGVGGGGIYVPLGILLLNFSPKPSSGLSQSSIFGASLGGLLLNLRNTHPLVTKVSQHGTESEPAKDQEGDENTKYYTRPVIDFDMALFLAPMEMAGAVLGVLIQKVLPDWLYLTLAVIILGFTAWKTFSKYKATKEKENAAPLPDVSQENSSLADDSKLESVDGDIQLVDETMETSEEVQAQSQQSLKNRTDMDGTGSEEVSIESVTELSTSLSEAEQLERRQFWLDQDARQYPVEKFFGLFALWVGLVFLTFLKGGKGVGSIIGITCESPWYGVLIAVQFVWTLGISAIFGFRLTKQTEDKLACKYPMHPIDIVWTFEKVRFYAFFTFIAGIVAGLIGIGGGMVLGPLMLIMGIHPRVSSATTATMVVLTSSSVAILFVTSGLVPWEYAVSFFFVCLVGAYVGKTKIDSYVKKSGKSNVLVLFLAIIIALATAGCLLIIFLNLSAADWCFDGFKSFCTVSEDESEGDQCPVDRVLFGRPFSH